MSDINISAGNRLRQIREIINEGGKLSAEQFGFILNESKDKIINYELGRTAIPLRILYELYVRGINPIFIITGEGEIFSNNDKGAELRKIFERKLASGNISTIDRAKINAALDGGEKFTLISDTVSNFSFAAGKIEDKKR